MYAITGATGQLGHLVITALLEKVPAGEIVAVVRSPEKAADLAALGVVVRAGDYDRPETLAAAFAGVSKLLLISSNEIGRREAQHRTAIEAARDAGVGLIVYTSLLHADTSTLDLGVEHRATEALLRDAGVPFALLRNGWYTENYAARIDAALSTGALVGSAGAGRISFAARADYAAAAAAVLTADEDQGGRIYELAGDSAYTLSDLAAEIARQAGRDIAYTDLPEAAYRETLIEAGLPEIYAGLLSESDAKSAAGALFDDGGDLSALIGRPTTPLTISVAAALA
ncbi:SDR family oxidoreductase [Sphingomonas alpina]|uniref:SDR family oxidoreductase n=1 Tax=Sphingomonas alpina TaxID=653931 RepID=A0A7H0LD82_9SPHN|nr:SDR family oxidoreductase [Sphingomonas alpina]QNQ07635.1 SDR family oxidoreductase [Sphingomonas alpina]